MTRRQSSEAPSRQHRFRSVLARLLGIIACIALLSVAVLSVLYLSASQRVADRYLDDKVRDVAGTLGKALAEPLRAGDQRQIERLLEAQLHDPDVIGVVVYAASGDAVRSAGVMTDAGQSVHIASRPVAGAAPGSGGGSGKVEVALTDRRLRQQLKARYVFAAWTAVAVAAAIALFAALFYRRTVREPLARLTESMHAASDRGERTPVAWSSRDEMGEVVSAFNRMQSVQQDHEQGLRASRDEEKRILEVASSISSELELDVLLRKVITIVTNLLGAEAASLFLHDPETDELWSRVWEGTITQEIRIPASTGLAGACFASGEVLNIPDPYADPRFNRDVDRRTGYRTRNILCMPVRNRLGAALGVLQLVNKIEGAFDEWDVDRLQAFSGQFAIALENAQLYEDLKALDKAKEKVINHLSHELKTPLVILSGVIELVQKELASDGAPALNRALNRARRNIQRLMDLQLKIDDIIQQRPADDKNKIAAIIETAVDLVDDLGTISDPGRAELLSLVSDRLEALFGMVQADDEWVDVGQLLNETCDRALLELGMRKLDITRDIAGNLRVLLNPDVLTKACEGILKNAIENTPDHGIIEVTAKKNGEEVAIEVQDYGVGITAGSQQLIFGGFFHTQSTDAYSSKRPYQFNAGGSGTDLLRIKCLSERYGFSVDFDSVRCRHIPGDDDVCPGRVTECRFIKAPLDCRTSGGSRFSIRIPAPLESQPKAG